VAVVAPTAPQRAETPVGADGATEAACVVAVIGSEGGLEPPAVVLTTVIWYVVWGWSGPTSPLAAEPLTVVTTGAEPSEGDAVSVEEIIVAVLATDGVQDTWN
jgi:hypothetical protein